MAGPYSRPEDDDDLGSDANFHEFEQAIGLSSGDNVYDHENGQLSPVSAAADWTDSSSSTFSQTEVAEDGRFMQSPSVLSVRSFASSRKSSGGDRKRWSVLMEKASHLKDQLAAARDEMSNLRQDAGDLQEYSNAKLTRVNRFLGVLAERARTLDQAASDAELRITPLKKEHRKLFNDILTAKGRIRIFCRVRPQFEGEGVSATSFPNDCTVQVNQAAGGGAFQPANAKKDYEFDHVYGPHISQERLFQDIQPLMLSVLHGFNACVMAYGQAGSGKTYTMEGRSHDRGVCYRAFDELFDLANSSLCITSKYVFHVSILELYNDQMRDLLGKQPEVGGRGTPPKAMEIRQTPEDGVVVVDLAEEKVETPVDFAKAVKTALQNRAKEGGERSRRSHLLVTVHVRHTDMVTGARQHSKLHLVDLACSERLARAEASGERLTASLFINQSLSALGDCLSTLTAKKGTPPFSNSKLTLYLSDSMGGESKVIMIANCSPGQRDAAETVASLNFATRARNVELSLGSRDTIKKWRDMANEARLDARDKERQREEVQEEALRLQEALKGAEEQAGILFEELQRSWLMAGALQTELVNEHNRSAELQAELEALKRTTEEDKTRLQQKDKEHEEAMQRQLAAQQEAVQRQAAAYEEVLECQAAIHHEAVRKLKEDMETRIVMQQAMHAEALSKQQEEAAAERNRQVATLKVRLHQLQQQLAEATAAAENAAAMAAVGPVAAPKSATEAELRREFERAQEEVARLKAELKKSGELAERLTQENERLVGTLVEAAKKSEDGETGEGEEGGESRERSGEDAEDVGGLDRITKLNGNPKGTKYLLNVNGHLAARTTSNEDARRAPPHPLGHARMSEHVDAVLAGRPKRGQLSPTAEQLMALLDNCDLEQMEHPMVVAERANKLLKQFLVTVVTAEKEEEGRDSELLGELRETVLEMLARVQGYVQLDSTLIARIRLLYLRALLAKVPELQALKVAPVEAFLEKEGADRPKADMNGGSEVVVWPMRISLKTEKKLQKFLSFGSKSKHDQGKANDKSRDAGKFGKASDIFAEAKAYAISNGPLATLLAHTDHEEISRRIRRWLAENFDHLPISTGPDGELGQLTKAILDGWMAGSGTGGKSGARDALGALFGDYTRRTYIAQLQHLTDLSSTLATEEVDDLVTMNRLRTQLESVELKRRKALREMQADPALVERERLEAVPRNPLEEARLASLFVLEDVLRLCEEAKKGGSLASTVAAKKRAQLAKFLSEKVPIMLPVDRNVAERHITQAQRCIEVQATPAADTNSLPSASRSMTAAQAQRMLGKAYASTGSARSSALSREVFPPSGGPGIPEALRGELVEWSTVQFNSRAGSPPVLVKCGATSRLELVVKVVPSKVPGADPSSSPEVRILPYPTVLEGLSLAAMTKELETLPEALKTLAVAKNAIHTKERYNRLFKTLAARIPAMQKAMGGELAEYMPGQRQSLSLAAHGAENGDGDMRKALPRAVSTSSTVTDFPSRLVSQPSLPVHSSR